MSSVPRSSAIQRRRRPDTKTQRRARWLDTAIGTRNPKTPADRRERLRKLTRGERNDEQP